MHCLKKESILKNNYVKLLLASGILLAISGCASPNILENRGAVPPPALAPTGEQGLEPAKDELNVPISPDQQVSITEQKLPGTGLTDFPKVEAKEIQYKVKRGDSFWLIAKRYGVGMKELAAYNNMDVKKPLKAGTTINIPPGGKLVTDTFITKGESSFSSTSGNYTVKKGDTLWGIAKKNGVSLDALAAANKISKKTMLKVGQKLTIPNKKEAVKIEKNERTITVRPGQSLWMISQRYKVSVDDLAKANKISKNSVLKVGQKLYIPGNESLNDTQQSAKPKPASKTATPKKEAKSAAAPTDNKNLSKEDTDLINDLIGTSTAAPSGKSKTTETKEVSSQSINYLPHTVKDGDTWNTISEMYGVSIDNLKKANPKVSSDKELKSGTVINIPEE